MLKQKIDQEDYNDGYYHLSKDIKDYPDAVFYVVWSRRGPGKTYSGCRYFYYTDTPFLYMKRTLDDVDFIMKSDEYGVEDRKNPFVPVNRDFGINVLTKSTGKGRGIFYEEKDDLIKAVAHCESLNNVKRLKGFDYTFIDYMWFDEFIPMAGERISKTEDEQLLSVYMTVLRDRMQRGRPPLKLILTSNTDQISTPITRGLEILDDMAEMSYYGEHIRYLKDRKILLHHITDEECPNLMAEDEGIFAAMAGTQWADKNLLGKFSNVDFSNIIKMNIKKYYPRCICLYQRKAIYIYQHKNNGAFYLSSLASGKNDHLRVYDLERDSDQRAFYLDYIFDMKNALILDKLKSEKYSYYDMVIQYKQYFDI